MEVAFFRSLVTSKDGIKKRKKWEKKGYKKHIFFKCLKSIKVI